MRSSSGRLNEFYPSPTPSSRRYRYFADDGHDFHPPHFFHCDFYVYAGNGIDVSKPKASTVKELSKESILIGITRQGTIHINETQVNLSSLQTILKQMMNEAPDRPVVIVSDRDAPSGKIVDVLDECNLAHVRKVSISAAKE